MKKAIILLLALLGISLFYTASICAEVTLNLNCHINSAPSVNFSNGTEIFLPFEYTKTTIENSNLVIFSGTNTDEFCNTINDSIEDYAADGVKIIFTPEFFTALQSSDCSAATNRYFSNFKKSGKITSSSGTAFCSWDRMNISYSPSPNGIYFDTYNITNISVDDGATYSYSMRNLKRYGMAYLMKNPTVAFSGVVKLLAEAIHLNYLCGGYPNVNAYFDAAKNDYNSKYKDKILDADYTAGEVLEVGSDIPGSWAFGWLANYALGHVHVPIIEALNLSDNVYLCSLEELRGYSENTHTFNTASETLIDAKTSTNVTLSINVSANLSAKIKIASYNENPGSNSYSLTSLEKYIAITTNSSNLVNNLSNITIKVYYTDAEVTAAGLDENSLRLEYYNASSDSWGVFNYPRGGVDIASNYVWAVTNHFSIWGIFGSLPQNTANGGSTGLYLPHILNITPNLNTALPLENVTINETNRSILFDISVKINKKNVLANEKLISTISLTNFGVAGDVKVNATYKIIDDKRAVVYQENEIISVQTQKEFIKEFNVSSLKPGAYTLSAAITYEGQTEPAQSEEVFYIRNASVKKLGWWIISALGIIIAGIILTIVYLKIKKELRFRDLARRVHIYFTPKTQVKRSKKLVK